jgi:hypothetical protein
MGSPKKHLPYIELLFVMKVRTDALLFQLFFTGNFISNSQFCCGCTGFSEIMAILSKIGFFDVVDHPLLQDINRPTYRSFLHELLNINNISTTATNDKTSGGLDDELISRLLILGQCKEKEIAVKTDKTIKLVTDPVLQNLSFL